MLFPLAYGRWGSLIELRGRLHRDRSHDGSLSFADCDVSCLFVLTTDRFRLSLVMCRAFFCSDGGSLSVYVGVALSLFCDSRWLAIVRRLGSIALDLTRRIAFVLRW